MKESFQKMQPNEKLPEDLKDNVFNTLDTFRLMADVVNLFTVDYVGTELDLLDTINPKREEDD